MGAWNLTPKEWANVLLKESTPEEVAENVRERRLLPWTENLLRYTEDSKEVLDMGCGAGQNSALLACEGRKTTLLDISPDNLAFSAKVFKILGLSGKFQLADMVKPLPFGNDSFDTVFSVGVFEYFTDKEIRSILREAFRVSRKRVIVMVPNAFSIAYRIGYLYSKQTHQWVWGGERPYFTLKPYFKSVADIQFFEFTVAARHSLSFLTMPKGDLIRRLIIRKTGLHDSSRPSRFRQGYILISVGEKHATAQSIE